MASCPRRGAHSGGPRAGAWAPVGLVFFLLACSASGTLAADVVLLVADRLERADLWENTRPHLARLRREAAAGLMSHRFPLSALPESATVALGAGSFVQYEGSRRWRGGDADDAAAFRLATGRALPPGALYCRESERLALYSNADARPGTLGTALHAAGKRTACIGNADVPGTPRRQILSLLMDAQGLVDAGDVSAATLRPDADAPGGACTDVSAVLRVYDRVAARAGVVAIEFGDTSRLAWHRETLAPEAYARARVAALGRLDALVGALRERIDPRRTLFVLLSPAPPAVSAMDLALTPILAVGRGWEPGLLHSGTTRRAGVIASADVPATVAALAGAGPLPGGAGWPLSAVPAERAGERLRDVDDATRRVVRWRVVIFQLWALILGPALLMGPLGLVARARRGRDGFPWARWARALSLGAMALPGGMFLAACFTQESPARYAAALAAGAILLAAAAAGMARVLPRVPPPAWLALLTTALLLGDAALGAPRQWRMMINYALTGAARYYGVGNEMMGAIVGLSLVGVFSVRRRGSMGSTGSVGSVGGMGGAAAPPGPYSPHFLHLLPALLLGTAIGHPRIGANFGGGLTAAIALSTAAVALAGIRGRRAVALPLSAAGLVALVLVGLDLLHSPETMTHVGRAVGSLQAEGQSWASAVIARKAHMNAVLLRYSGVTTLFFAALPVFLALSLRPPRVGLGHSAVRPLLLSGVVGSAAAFLLNDSGIIAGGLMLLFVVIGAGWLALVGDGEGETAACASSR